jgi:thiol-disulfide isomerase/thioredoxin
MRRNAPMHRAIPRHSARRPARNFSGLAVFAGLLLLLAACGPDATATPVPPLPTATPAAAQPGAPTATTAGAGLPTAIGTVPTGATLPNGPATVGTGGGDQPLPTTSPGVVAKPPTPPPGVLTLPTPVPTAPLQNLPNPETTGGPSGLNMQPGDPVIGSPAPDFSGIRLDTGADMRLSDFKGHPVWINFWATWCGPCKAEMPQMQAIYEAHKDSDLVILGVDFREDADVVRPFVAGKFGWTFALDSDGQAALTYFVPGIPTHVFVNRDGTIRDIVTAGLDRQAMEQQVAALLQ